MADQRNEDIARAVRDLIVACGLEVDHADLKGTPRRVAELWAEDILAGYSMEPRRILAEAVLGEADPELVWVTDLSFHSMCPHHLLPYQGRAHVVYLPDGRLPGFGQIARLVTCFTRRLTLQERATHQIAQAIVDHLPARGAACALSAHQLCLAMPGDRHSKSAVLTTATAGELRRRPDVLDRLLAASTKHDPVAGLP